MIHTEEENERNNAEEHLGIQRIASGVLRGEWDLSSARIQELAERFKLPELLSPKPQKNI